MHTGWASEVWWHMQAYQPGASWSSLCARWQKPGPESVLPPEQGTNISSWCWSARAGFCSDVDSERQQLIKHSATSDFLQSKQGKLLLSSMVAERSLTEGSFPGSLVEVAHQVVKLMNKVRESQCQVTWCKEKRGGNPEQYPEEP